MGPGGIGAKAQLQPLASPPNNKALSLPYSDRASFCQMVGLINPHGDRAHRQEIWSKATWPKEFSAFGDSI